MFNRKRNNPQRGSFWSAPILLLLCLPAQSPAAEGPFFITYTHQMEEPGNLEFAVKSVTGQPAPGNRFWGGVAEFEYGLKGWWSTEVYLDAQTTHRGSTGFTGYRWENRFRLLPREHWINPVLYVEFENINGSDRALLEVVGTDGKADLTPPDSETRKEKKREVEAKLILGSHLRGWTIAENLIVEKNIRHAPFEFGYAVGVSRPLALAARPGRCQFCPENFQVGVEMYGGLGTHADFGLHDTSSYLAPTAAWTLTNGTTLRVSPAFGITGTSANFLLRLGASYEIPRIMHRAHSNPTKGSVDTTDAGAKLFERECSACHGRRAEGMGRAPSLTSGAIANTPPDALLRVLRNGSLQRGMPSFAHLPEAQRRQIITYLQTLK